MPGSVASRTLCICEHEKFVTDDRIILGIRRFGLLENIIKVFAWKTEENLCICWSGYAIVQPRFRTDNCRIPV